MRRPTLEDVYLELVGDERSGRDAAHASNSPASSACFWRNREGAFFVFLFDRLPAPARVGLRRHDRAATRRAICCSSACSATARPTRRSPASPYSSIRRESGLLKRIRATPLPATTYLLAVLLSMLVVFLLQSVAMFASRISMFGADGPDDVVSLLAVMPLGVAAFAGMGFGAAALIRSSDGASAVVNLVLLPMAFISGSFVPTQEYLEWLQTLGDVLPLKHLIDLLRGVYLDGMPIWDARLRGGRRGLGRRRRLVAARRFSWEPRER